jgi:hypothetical protein
MPPHHVNASIVRKVFYVELNLAVSSLFRGCKDMDRIENHQLFFIILIVVYIEEVSALVSLD